MIDVSNLTAAERAELLALLEDVELETPPPTELPVADKLVYAALDPVQLSLLPKAQLTACYVERKLAFGREYESLRVHVLGAKRPLRWNKKEGKWEDA